VAAEKPRLKEYLIIAGLALNSLLLNGYRYDYNLLVSWLNSNNNRELFTRDLFVNTIDKFEISFFYSIVEKLSAFIDLPILFFLIHIMTLYLACVFLFRLSSFIADSNIAGYLSVLLFSMGIREWVVGAPQIYYFFVHHSAFSLPFFFLALELFLRGNVVASLFLLGILSNFQMMYASFIGTAFAFAVPLKMKHESLSFKKLFCGAAAFIIPAIPVILKVLTGASGFTVGDEWYKVVKWVLWIHIYPSMWGFEMYRNFIVYIICFAVAFRAYPAGLIKNTIKSMLAGVAFLCFLGTFFVEVVPVPLFIQLHLWRSTWIFFIFSIPVFSNFILRTFGESLLSKFAAVSTALVFAGYVTIRYNDPRCFFYTPYWMLPLFVLLCLVSGSFNVPEGFKKTGRIFIGILAVVVMAESTIPYIRGSFFDIGVSRLLMFVAALSFASLLSIPAVKSFNRNRRFAFTSLLCVCISLLVISVRGGAYLPVKGYYDGRMGEWIELQLYARDHTPVDSLFIVPPYRASPDFRFYSHRASLGDWVDGGFAIFFGNDYAKEWLSRMNSIGLDGSTLYDEGLDLERKQYAGLNEKKVLDAARRFGADYVVTEKGSALPFKKIYENSRFVLYKIFN